MTLASMNGVLADQRRQKGARKVGANSYIRERYRGLPPHRRAMQAALDASNNGKCWWVYKHVMDSLLGDKI